MIQIIVIRDVLKGNATLGKLYVKHADGKVVYIGESLERAWKDNAQMESCIPVGIYPLKFEYSPRFKQSLWEVYGVPNRRECKFHAANYWKQLNGCIAPGERRVDIDRDGTLDVTNSKKTLAKLHKEMGGAIDAILVVKNI